jgi:hypothetical protein
MSAMATRPIDLRSPTAEPRRRDHLRAVTATDRTPATSPAPGFDPTRFEEDRQERRERLATTGRGPRRLAASLLVAADAWMAPRQRDDRLTGGAGDPTPVAVDLTTADLTTVDLATVDPSPPARVTAPAPAGPVPSDRARPLRARERPLRADRSHPAPDLHHGVAEEDPITAGGPAGGSVPAAEAATARPSQAGPDRPLRAQRNRPLRAQQDRPLPTKQDRPLRGDRVRPLQARTEAPVAVVPVPARTPPVLAMVDMREQHRSDRTPQAEPDARSRRPGRARKTMPDPRAIPPEVAAADEEAWQAWLTSSEPAGDRLEQLDADLARSPRRLSRWVDAAASSRRTRTD